MKESGHVQPENEEAHYAAETAEIIDRTLATAYETGVKKLSLEEKALTDQHGKLLFAYPRIVVRIQELENEMARLKEHENEPEYSALHQEWNDLQDQKRENIAEREKVLHERDVMLNKRLESLQASTFTLPPDELENN